MRRNLPSLDGRQYFLFQCDLSHRRGYTEVAGRKLAGPIV